MTSIDKLRAITTKQDKLAIFILFILSLALSIIETVGISVIMPFITLASNPDLILDNVYSKAIYQFFGFSSKLNFMIFFGIALIFFYIFRASYSITYFYLLNKFTYSRFHTFAFRLFKNYINLPYKVYVKKNSADLIRNVLSESGNLTNYLNSVMLMMVEILTITCLYILLILVNWKMTLVLTAFMGLKVFFIVIALKKKIKKEGEKRVYLETSLYKTLIETFGNFKIIKLIQNEEKIYNDFSNASRDLAKVNIINNTLNQIPKLSLETVGFGVLISIVIYVLIQYQDASFVLPTISMYALALYRILPAVNKIINNYNQTVFLEKSLDIMYENLTYKPPIEGKDYVKFEKTIELKYVSFEYIKSKKVLKNINLIISKGDKVAFIGPSGSGKSTLVDLMIGLYKPLSGDIYIDDQKLTQKNIRAFRSKVGYIPQSIYLFDGTVGENVAFGYEYDEFKIIDVLKKANIYDFLSTKDGIDTRVGEGGIQLSGGQKQRIGIARALYADPEILVLDEATSALDNETEAKIMDEIYEVSGNKTLLIIAHRLSTIEKCERIIKLENGSIVKNFTL